MRRFIAFLACALLACCLAAAKELQIYFIDVEGGQATLIVGPSGQSMLVDAGWPGYDGRDVNRIAAAARLAGIQRIDYLLLTHYHLDHVGGIPPLVEKIPVGTFVDHGPNTETGKGAQALSAAYEEALAKGKHLVVKPGDRVPLEGVDVRIVEARGQAIPAPIKGAGTANPACEASPPQAEDNTENGRSVGFVLSFGKFRFLDLGDLTWNKELALMCPKDRIGPVDVFLVSHHGMDISNSPALVHAIRPKVAILNNGVKKGGSPKAWEVVRSSPGLADLWQLHYAVNAGQDHNVPAQFIANPDEGCRGDYLKVLAQNTGAFTVTNSRTAFTKKY